ncbi:MAG: hypothetical protein KDB80_05085 [Planctomycetes bacterium]|nr:hypothetical protein [Planctomycetota bacterium]
MHTKFDLALLAGATLSLAIVPDALAQIVCEPPIHYGSGTAGATGYPPVLTTGGRPARAGDPEFSIDASLIAANSQVALLISTNALSTTALGASILVDPSTLVGTVSNVSTPLGQASFPLPLPPGASLVGRTFYAQLLALDAGAPQGLATSSGLELTICDASPERNIRDWEATCHSQPNPTCTIGQPGLESYSDASGAYEWPAVRVEFSRNMAITRIAGVGATATEDYANLQVTLHVFQRESYLGAGGPSYSIPNLTLRNPNPPVFGGTSVLGVPNRYLEFDVTGLDVWADGPMTLFLVIERPNSGPGGLVWSMTRPSFPRADLRTSDALRPSWENLGADGQTSGVVAIDVFARDMCADFEVTLNDLLIELYTSTLPELHAAAESVGHEICAPLYIMERPDDGSTPRLRWQLPDIYGNYCFSDGIRTQCLTPIEAAAAAMTQPGSVSAWLCVYELGTSTPSWQPILLTSRYCQQF